MSSYVRAIRPLMKYFTGRLRRKGKKGTGRSKKGVRFLATRSRTWPSSQNRSRSRSRSAGPSRKRARSASVSSASSAYGAAAGSGHNSSGVINFRHGKLRGGSNRGVANMMSKIVPIQTHIMSSFGDIRQNTSGAASYTVFPFGIVQDLNDMLAKGYAANGGVANGLTAGYSGKLSLHGYSAELILKNFVNAGVRMVVYECLARKDIVIAPGYVDSDSLNDMLQNGFLSKAYVAAGNMAASQVDSTLYMNPDWCRWFKIVNQRELVLQAGEETTIRLCHGRQRTLNPIVLGTASGPTAAPLLGIGGFTRCIVVKVYGDLIDNSANIDSVDFASFKLDYHIKRIYRWNSLPYGGQFISQTISAPVGIATNLQGQEDVATGQAINLQPF